MQKLLSLFTLTLTFLANLKSHAAETKTQLDTSNALIADLKAKLDKDQVDEAALLKRAETAEARAASIDAAAAQVESQAAELAAAINEHPNTPTVDPSTLGVTAPGEPVSAEPASGAVVDAGNGSQIPPGTGWAAPDAAPSTSAVDAPPAAQ